MRRVAVVACFVVLNLVPWAAKFAHGEKPPRPGTVRLEDVKQIRRGVDAWPLIILPKTPATERINATLKQLNAQMKGDLRTCDANYRAWASSEGQYLHGKTSTSNDWIRSISVTMTGPGFLSLMATDDYIFCGGAHPNNDTAAMVFDLQTGNVVDWSKMIAASAGATVLSTSAAKETVVLPALRDLSVDTGEADCRDVFESKQAYVLWPDAQEGALMAVPSGLPHAAQACAVRLTVTPQQARQMGFSETLLHALEEVDGPRQAAKEQ